jgi:hypothetical protein
MNDSSRAGWVVWLLVAAAIIAMILLVRGTPDHSRFDDAPLTSRVETLA